MDDVIKNLKQIASVFTGQLMIYGMFFQSELLAYFEVDEFGPTSFQDYLAAAFGQPWILLLALGIDIFAFWNIDNTTQPKKHVTSNWFVNIILNIFSTVRHWLGNSLFVCAALAFTYAWAVSDSYRFHDVSSFVSNILPGKFFRDLSVAFAILVLFRLLFVALRSSKEAVAITVFLLALILPFGLSTTKINEIRKAASSNDKNNPHLMTIVLDGTKKIEDVIPISSNSNYSFFLPKSELGNGSEGKEVALVIPTQSIRLIRPSNKKALTNKTDLNSNGGRQSKASYDGVADINEPNNPPPTPAETRSPGQIAGAISRLNQTTQTGFAEVTKSLEATCIGLKSLEGVDEPIQNFGLMQQSLKTLQKISSSIKDFLNSFPPNVQRQDSSSMRKLLAEHYFYRGLRRYSQNRFLNACHCLNEAVRFDETDSRPFLLRAVVKCRLGDEEGALDDLSLAGVAQKHYSLAEDEGDELYQAMFDIDLDWVSQAKEQLNKLTPIQN